MENSNSKEPLTEICPPPTPTNLPHVWKLQNLYLADACSTHQCPECGLLEDGVAGELGERAELDGHGAHACRARHRGLAARHAVAQVHSPVRHPRRRVERGQKPECI